MLQCMFRSLPQGRAASCYLLCTAVFDETALLHATLVCAAVFHKTELQQTVRELRRPGGARPHGDVQYMVLPKGGQVSPLPPATVCPVNLEVLGPRTMGSTWCCPREAR